jgi:diguanylate cyclase (GGDEF)-like protein
LLFTDRTTQQALASAQAQKRGCALLMVDLDHFKMINDSLAHASSAITCSKRWRNVCGDVLAGHYAGTAGGDEFAVLAESCPQLVQLRRWRSGSSMASKSRSLIDEHRCSSAPARASACSPMTH